MPVNDELDMTPLKCPYCKTPMNLMSGNLVFSYWECETCHKKFVFNVWTEEFTYEINK